MSNLDKSCFSFSPPPPNVIYLISGSITFLNELPAWLRHKKGTFITESHFRVRRHLPTCTYVLHRISHVQVGGCTTYESVCSYLSEPLRPHTSILKRRLGDFLDYSLAPLTIKAPEFSLSYSSLLPVQHTSKLVHYPTPFSTLVSHCSSVIYCC